MLDVRRSSSEAIRVLRAAPSAPHPLSYPSAPSCSECSPPPKLSECSELLQVLPPKLSERSECSPPYLSAFLVSNSTCSPLANVVAKR